MILKVHAIYDSKVGSYSQPIFTVSTGSGVRAFEDAVNDPKSDFHRHPGDFTLFEIGEYDDQLGEFRNINKINLGTAIQFKKADVRPPLDSQIANMGEALRSVPQ